MSDENFTETWIEAALKQSLFGGEFTAGMLVSHECPIIERERESLTDTKHAHNVFHPDEALHQRGS